MITQAVVDPHSRSRRPVEGAVEAVVGGIGEDVARLVLDFVLQEQIGHHPAQHRVVQLTVGIERVARLHRKLHVAVVIAGALLEVDVGAGGQV